MYTLTLMKTTLANVNDDVFWANKSWIYFSKLSNKQKYTIIAPVCGFANWDRTLPLDTEENLLLELLNQALKYAKKKILLQILPPFRFVLGPSKNACFSLNHNTAYAYFMEIFESVQQSGFKKLLIYNSSPYNEEFVRVLARDARISIGIQVFTLNTVKLGLDFNEQRAQNFKQIKEWSIQISEGRKIKDANFLNLSKHLASILLEIQEFPPLSNDGKIKN